jgi:N-acetylmuramoyl-L-alanine amidase
LVSVHHDSVQDVDLRSTEAFGRRQSYTDAASGFSIFVSRENREYERSLELASMIGRRLTEAGFDSNTYHGLNIPGEGRLLVDPSNNVYEYNELAVLRHAARPAVLVELGVIKNPLDEARARDPEYVSEMAGAIAAALVDFSLRCSSAGRYGVAREALYDFCARC